jgi:hypothetical protein
MQLHCTDILLALSSVTSALCDDSHDFDRNTSTHDFEWQVASTPASPQENGAAYLDDIDEMATSRFLPVSSDDGKPWDGDNKNVFVISTSATRKAMSATSSSTSTTSSALPHGNKLSQNAVVLANLGPIAICSYEQINDVNDVRTIYETSMSCSADVRTTAAISTKLTTGTSTAASSTTSTTSSPTTSPSITSSISTLDLVKAVLDKLASTTDSSRSNSKSAFLAPSTTSISQHHTTTTSTTTVDPVEAASKWLTSGQDGKSPSPTTTSDSKHSDVVVCAVLSKLEATHTSAAIAIGRGVGFW